MNDTADPYHRIGAFLSYVTFFALLGILVVLNVNDVTDAPYDWGLASQVAVCAGLFGTVTFFFLSPRARLVVRVLPLFVLSHPVTVHRSPCFWSGRMSGTGVRSTS